MAKKALILIEGHRSNGPLYVEAARRLGLHPITLTDDPTGYEYLARLKAEVIEIDTSNLDSLIRKCYELQSSYCIAGITGFAGRDESIYLTVSKLCCHFNLPGPNPASIERCSDKSAQRRLLTCAGVPTPAYRVATNAVDVTNFAAEIGLPVILKPVVGSGSTGVQLCRNADELAEHTARLLCTKYASCSSQKILIEEFVVGPHFSVDTMGNEVVAIGSVEFGRPPHFVARKSIFPAPLPDDQYQQIASVSLSCLRAVGLDWGPANIEVRWTQRGPVVIEINPRLPGCSTPQLIQLALGVDLITGHIKLLTGQEWASPKRHLQTAALQFLVPNRDGILDWIDGDRRAAAEDGVAEVALYVRPGMQITRKGDDRDLIGHVIAASPTLVRTEAILEEAVSLIGWSIAPFPEKPSDRDG
ncbi:biotin carboxylase-like ATP-grasp domain-containing protein (plasmid) [Rhizobium sp. NXC14]|uniref:ATP-grasp domain-containing protein n=1 Tax=Rhizobium sp. NXC14 TaxID=1981173 RepID=UPI000A20AB97|nr:ATP-grasp domain-containing protein [Rhizobium sp. NXC14]ARO32621.1 biotin carboxylase-like ATP-grasp domain-containing protein [Rhizobium sp. NXC14]